MTLYNWPRAAMLLVAVGSTSCVAYVGESDGADSAGEVASTAAPLIGSTGSCLSLSVLRRQWTYPSGFHGNMETFSKDLERGA